MAQTIDEGGRVQSAYANRRAEIYGNLKTALEGQFCLPDRDDLQGELVSMSYKNRSDGAVLLEFKDEIRKRLGASPDLADAVALCFADGPPGTRIEKSRSANFNRVIHYPKHAGY
jgi:hypothetical protein